MGGSSKFNIGKLTKPTKNVYTAARNAGNRSIWDCNNIQLIIRVVKIRNAWQELTILPGRMQ